MDGYEGISHDSVRVLNWLEYLGPGTGAIADPPHGGLYSGQVGNLILYSTVDVYCSRCGELVPAGETHRHDGPLPEDRPR